MRIKFVIEISLYYDARSKKHHIMTHKTYVWRYNFRPSCSEFSTYQILLCAKLGVSANTVTLTLLRRLHCVLYFVMHVIRSSVPFQPLVSIFPQIRFLYTNMFVSASQVSVLCACTRWWRCGNILQKKSNNNEKQCDIQSRKINAWGKKTFKTFIWKTCQSTVVSMTINVVWQETPCIYHKTIFFKILLPFHCPKKISRPSDKEFILRSRRWTQM